MAYKNKIIKNPKTGQDIRFIQTANDTNGLLLEMESTYNVRSKAPKPHYHPLQSEEFIVISGELTVMIDGQTKILKQGDMLYIPANKVHAMWNNSAQKTVVNWKVQPAMDTDNLLETITGLANENKTNEDGMPGILQLALTANKYSNVFRLASPPFSVQKILFSILTPFAYLMKYKSNYKKYFL